jgi:hypothetical protein
MDWIDAISRWVSRTRDVVVMGTGMLFRPYDIGREVAKWVSGVSSAQNAACEKAEHEEKREEREHAKKVNAAGEDHE